MISQTTTDLEVAVENFDHQYRVRGLRSQRTYPNESLVQFLSSRYFELPLSERKSIRILEIGCGFGANLCMMAKEGLDASAEGIAQAERHLCDKWGMAANLKVGSFTQIPYPEADSFPGPYAWVSTADLAY